MSETSFRLQVRIFAWLRSRFGDHVATSLHERAARVLEEAAELAQAEGLDRAYAERVLTRVYSRPPGEPSQEAAGVAVTLYAWAAVSCRDVDELARIEVERIEGLPIEHFRRKHAEKALDGTALAGTPPADIVAKGRVRLLTMVYGDFPFQETVAPAGEYIAHSNQHGAVSVLATNGRLLGVKPHEFEWVERP